MRHGMKEAHGHLRNNSSELPLCGPSAQVNRRPSFRAPDCNQPHIRVSSSRSARTDSGALVQSGMLSSVS